jgi:GT2 family glycosyltransferase
MKQPTDEPRSPERIETLEFEVRLLNQELDLYRKQLKEYERTVHDLTHSSSWRLTRPLRGMKNLLHALTRRVRMLRYAPRFFVSVHQRGLGHSLALARRRLFAPKKTVTDTGFELSPTIREAQKQRVFDPALQISILVPLFNTDEAHLAQLIDSIRDQTYANWELCLADASDEAHEGVGALCRQYAEGDARIRYRKLESNGGIAANTNEALAMARGDYLALLDHDDVLHPSALYEVMKAIAEQQADLIYSDEADFTSDPRQAWYPPHYKPDFSPDTLRSYNYICHLMVFSRNLQERTGLFRRECDGSQDYDMALRLSEKAERIVHIPEVLYYWRKHDDSYSQDMQQLLRCVHSAKRALSDHLHRVDLPGTVEDAFSLTNYRIRYAIEKTPLISIVIPNKDHIRDLDTCLKSIFETSTYKNYEIIVVENNSVEQQTFDYYAGLPNLAQKALGTAGDIGSSSRVSDASDTGSGGTECDGTRPEAVKAEDESENTKSGDSEKAALRIPAEVITYEGAFNFPAINNFAAKRARGEYLLFLNNDTEVISPDWIQEMLMFAQRTDVAAVGARLLYPNDTIQHAGVVIGIGGVADHIHRNFKRSETGYYNRLQLAQNLTAVTGACMMVKARVFWEVGGFDEIFTIAFNDIDLCMRFRAAGYLNVFTPFAELYHHESKSRGYEDTPEKRRRFSGESVLFRERWAKELEAGDPYYNPHLSLEHQDFSLRVHDEEGGSSKR